MANFQQPLAGHGRVIAYPGQYSLEPIILLESEDQLELDIARKEAYQSGKYSRVFVEYFNKGIL